MSLWITDKEWPVFNKDKHVESTYSAVVIFKSAVSSVQKKTMWSFSVSVNEGTLYSYIILFPGVSRRPTTLFFQSWRTRAGGHFTGKSEIIREFRTSNP